MKGRFVLFAMAMLAVPYLSTAAAQQEAPNVPEHLTASIDTEQTAEPVSKYIFGSFIEHLGPLIYRSLWAEMLDDRKFYFPITSQQSEAPARRGGGFPGMQLRTWRPVGPDQDVVMDEEHPFVGDHSPRIELDPSLVHGISQTGIALVKGEKYTGRIYLRGTPGARVKVSLIWGEGANDRQTVSISAITGEYKRFPLSFTTGADTSAGTFEVVGTGSGDFHIGTVSLMPADAIDGFRPDTIALLKKLHSGMWRLPGGNFLSDWSWYNGVGDIDRRPPTFDYAWNAMQPNDVGLDEFMTLCKLIGVDPYLTVNAGFGDAHSAMEEVEYMNGATSTRLGAERARNGHPAPYHVKFWNIGNEPWGTFQLGYTPLKYYVLKNNEFAKAMREADPSITLIASAKMLEPMFLTGEDRAKYADNIAPLFGSDVDWTGGILKDCWGTFSGIAQHWYEGAGTHFDVQKAKSLPLDAPTSAAEVKYDPTTLEYARHAGDVILRHAEEWEGYQRRFPEMIPHKIFLSIDEYAYGGPGGRRMKGGPNLQSALAYGMLLDEMMRHSSFITMAAHTMGTSVLNITPTGSVLNPVGLVYELYGDHFPGTIPVAVNGNSPQPPTDSKEFAEEPKVSSGSPTYPLDLFAAITPDHKFLEVAVVNATEKEQKVDLSVTGARVSGASTLWMLSGKSLDAVNPVGALLQARIREIPMDHAPQNISVAPISVNVYRFPIVAQ
ncbi:MAG: alpha-N-arabinofuranosidase [Acidobacteriaceae bacterium]